MQKADIIHAAAEIFRQKGYQAASMQEIADAVGLQKASLYHHVSGKQEILLEILDQALDLLIDDMQTVLASPVPTDVRFREAIRTYIRRMTQEVGLAAVLQLEHRNLEPRLRARHIARRDRYDALWRSLVTEGVKSGVFRPVDEQIVTFALLGVQNWLITWYRPEGRLTPEEIADRFSDLFLSGLRSNRREKAQAE